MLPCFCLTLLKRRILTFLNSIKNLVRPLNDTKEQCFWQEEHVVSSLHGFASHLNTVILLPEETELDGDRKNVYGSYWTDKSICFKKPAKKEPNNQCYKHMVFSFYPMWFFVWHVFPPFFVKSILRSILKKAPI